MFGLYEAARVIFSTMLSAVLKILIFSLVVSVQAHAERRIVFLGDSLTEGYQLTKEDAYPYLIEQILHKEGLSDIKCINAGISGSTSASGPSRLKWYLKEKPEILVLALGANDGLRGLDLKETKKHLKEVITEAKKENIKILLAGMKMPPNYGVKFTKEFEKLFEDLAREEKVSFIPFLLESVAGKRELNLSDGIHPNPEGHKGLAQTVLKYLRPMLKTSK